MNDDDYNIRIKGPKKSKVKLWLQWFKNIFFSLITGIIAIIAFRIVFKIESKIFPENKIENLKEAEINIEWEKGKKKNKDSLDSWLKEEVNISGEFAKKIKELVKKEIFKSNFLNTNQSFGSIIFHGETGTGKTFLSEKIASSFSSSFCILSASDFGSKWVNGTANCIKKFELKILEQDKFNKDNGIKEPIIVVIDEIDTLILKKRNWHGSSMEDAKATDAFKTCCDVLKNRKVNVRIIGTTNNLEFIEEPSLRRLENKIEIGKIQVNLNFISNFFINFLKKIVRIEKIILNEKEYNKEENLIENLNNQIENIIKGKNILNFESIELKMSSLTQNIEWSIDEYLKKTEIDQEEENLKISLNLNNFLEIFIDRIFNQEKIILKKYKS